MVKLNRKILRYTLTVVVVLLALALGGLEYWYTLSTYHSSKGQNPFEEKLDLSSVWFAVFLYLHQLIQKILDAMRPESGFEEDSHSISLYQLNGTTYEEFSRYVTLLADLTNSQLDTFSPMTPSSRISIQNQMKDNIPYEKEIINNSSYFWLENSKDPFNEVKMPMLIQTSIQGEPYISRSWVTRCIDLYDFSKYYFNVLEDGDVGMLARLISSDSNKTDVRTKKASLTTAYYQNYNIDYEHDVHVRSLRMDEILIRIELSSEVSSKFGDSVLTLNRDLRIVSSGAGEFRILDDIRSPLEDKTFTVMHRGDPAILIGEYYESQTISKNFGFPRSISVNELPDWINYEGNASLIDIVYPNITLQVIGILHEKGNWEGVVRSVVIFGKTIHTGDGLHPNMKLDDLLLTYPFIDINNYTLRDGSHELYVGLDDKKNIFCVRLTDRRFDEKYVSR